MIDRSIKDLVNKNGHRCNAYTGIRGLARTVARNIGLNSCHKCGYNKHIEIAHIRAISDFPEDTPVSVVNSPDNLLALCPNCHWEFDNPKSKRNVCEICESPVLPKSKRCMNCRIVWNKGMNASFVQQITKQDLERLVWEMPTSHIAKRFGVSDKAVEKWCKKYEIIKPARGHWRKQSSKQGLPHPAMCQQK